MPSSDNLYSAEDSEGESFSEELSPSNGYFNGEDRQSRRNRMVPDPSINVMDDKKVEDKTLIPTPHPQASTGSSSRRTSLYPLLPRPASSFRPDASQSSNDGAPSSFPNTYTPTTPRMPRRSTSFSEYNSLMNVPPPAYSESSALSSSYTPRDQTPFSPLSPRDPRNETYSTFQEHHLEQGIPLHHNYREPESMGGPPPEAHERTPILEEPKPSQPNRRFRKLLFITFVFTFIVGLIGTVYHARASNQKPIGDMPHTGNPSKGTPGSDNPADADFTYCSAATYKRDQVVYEFPTGQDLTVLQTTHNDDQKWGKAHVETHGEIRLRRIPKDSEHGNRAYFTVDIAVSDPTLEIQRTWDEDSHTLKISTPRHANVDASARGRQCVSLQITAWFPEDAEFTNLLIEAISLTLRVFEDSRVKVYRRSKFTTISGDVYFPSIEDDNKLQLQTRTNADNENILTAPWFSTTTTHPFSSRRILVETVSGTISGTYPLLDQLALSTQSGDVRVSVSPQEAAKDLPAPADLEVQTASGSIRVALPEPHLSSTSSSSSSQDPTTSTFTPPARNYISNVHTSSGSIDGVYYVTSLGIFKSTSGSVGIKVVPFVQADPDDSLPDGLPGRFETHTVSGSHDIDVLDPLFIKSLSAADNKVVIGKGEGKSKGEEDPFAPVGDDSPYLNFPPTGTDKHRSVAPLSLSLADDSPSAPSTSSKKLRTLQSKHTSNSASVRVSYPRSWQGSVHAKTVSGDIAVSGKGMRMVKERKGWAFKEVLARKGVEGEGEGCYVEMGDISGELRFVVRE